MVLSFPAVYAAVATVTKFRVPEDCVGDYERDYKKDREIKIVAITRLITC